MQLNLLNTTHPPEDIDLMLLSIMESLSLQSNQTDISLSQHQRK